MTLKEKAEELVNRFIYRRTDYVEIDDAKQCALIAVVEIIKELTEEISPSVHGFRHKHWQEVKQEIEKL